MINNVTTLTTTFIHAACPTMPVAAKLDNEWRLDDALAQTFPASDPIAVSWCHAAAKLITIHDE
jgi:hypothetical protein